MLGSALRLHNTRSARALPRAHFRQGLLFGALSVTLQSVLQAKPPVRLRSVRFASFAVALSALLGACDGKTPPSSTKPSRTQDDRDASGDSAATAVSLTLGSEELSSGEITEVKIQVTPAGSHRVSVAIAEGGDLAFLNDSVVYTDSTGYAETTLTVARTGFGKLALRALVDGAEPGYFEIYVEAPSEASLNVLPLYSGDRPFTEWHVLILDSPTCPTNYAASVDQPSETFQRSPTKEPLPLSSVPAGRPVSVLVRAEEYAFGCTPGVVVTNDASQIVEVNVADEPLVVDDLAFPMRFGVYANSEPFWRDLSTYLTTTIANEFRGELGADSVALLSKMEELASSPEAFNSNRQAQSWDSLLEVRLTAAGASSGLTSRVQRWLLDGARLLQSNTALQADVKAKNSSTAAVQIASVAHLTPSELGIPREDIKATLNLSGTDDVVRLAFTLQFRPSRFFGMLASQVVAGAPSIDTCDPSERSPDLDGGVADASATNPDFQGPESADAHFDAGGADAGPSDPPSALAAIVGCTEVGFWLSEANGYAYEGCDETCASELCERAIEQLWQQVLDADTERRTLQISAAGRAELDSRAHVIGLTQGQWIGATNLFEIEGKGGTLQGCTSAVER